MNVNLLKNGVCDEEKKIFVEFPVSNNPLDEFVSEYESSVFATPASSIYKSSFASDQENSERNVKSRSNHDESSKINLKMFAGP